MKIGGLQKFSLVDYPGKISAIIFTQGCNLRCPYCHNPELLDLNAESKFDTQEVLDFLKSRIGKLDAVTVTGGEPTLQNDLPAFLKEIKDMGFLVKLDTNGTNPEMVEKLIRFKLVDYLAMDIKAPLDKYEMITFRHCQQEDLYRTIALMENSGLDFEFRTTVVEFMHSNEDILEIRNILKREDRYFIQKFVDIKTLEKDMPHYQAIPDIDYNIIREKCQEYFRDFGIR